MDSGEKCLPVTPGTTPMHIEAKHALVHSNYVVSGYRNIEVPKSKAWQKLLENLARIAIYQGINSKVLPYKMREYMESIRVNGIKIINILEEPGVEESMEIKWLKLLFNFKVKVDHNSGPLTLCPQIENIRYKAVSNKEKVFTRIAGIVSRSSFNMGDIGRVLEHCRGEIMRLQTKYTSFSDVVSLFQVVASYIGWRHENTTGKTLDLCRKQIQYMVRKGPHKLLRVKAKDVKALYQCTTTAEVTIGVKVTKNTEYLS